MALTRIHDGTRAGRGRVLLCGGGTVGHLAPAFALREALAALDVACAFVTPGEARERAWFPPDDDEPLHLAAPRLPRGPAEAASFPLRLGGAVAAALALLRRERPAAVVGLGGWPCAPAVLAAAAARVPLALLASDEVPGLVVRRLARRAGRVYVATEAAGRALPAGSRAVAVGRAVRSEVLRGTRDPARFGLGEGVATLLVVGGSLGARGLNRAVASGLAAAVASDRALAERLQVIHVAGGAPGEADAASEALRALSIRHHVAPFLRDVGDAYAVADLVLCRSGASTVAEVEALGLPAVFVPYPHHADGQQRLNAATLVARGAAATVEEADLDAPTFAREVLGRLLDPARLATMRAAARTGVRPPDAAAAMADDLVRWIEGEGSRRRPPGVLPRARRTAARVEEASPSRPSR